MGKRGKARGKNKRERVKMPEAVQSRINETKRNETSLGRIAPKQKRLVIRKV